MVIERKIINRISIDPELSTNVMALVKAITKAEGVALLKTTFESSAKQTKSTTVCFGKGDRVKLALSESSIAIPKQVHTLTDKYTITDLIDGIDALEIYAIRNEPTYTFDAYPVSLTLLDKGGLNKALHIVEFKKVRKIDPKSPVAELLGSIHMPIDLVSIYKAEHNLKMNKRKEIVPYKKVDIIRDINGEQKFVDADDVYRYTRHLYASDFCKVTTCEVGLETRETKEIIPIEGGSCSIGKKRTNDIDDSNKDISTPTLIN